MIKIAQGNMGECLMLLQLNSFSVFSCPNNTSSYFELFINANVYISFSQQFKYIAFITLFRLQVLNIATEIPARDYLLAQTTQVQPVILTATAIKYRHIPNSLQERSDSAGPFRSLRCGSWNEHTGGSHIWREKMLRTWHKDSESQRKVSR